MKYFPGAEGDLVLVIGIRPGVEILDGNLDRHVAISFHSAKLVAGVRTRASMKLPRAAFSILRRPGFVNERIPRSPDRSIRRSFLLFPFRRNALENDDVAFLGS